MNETLITQQQRIQIATACLQGTLSNAACVAPETYVDSKGAETYSKDSYDPITNTTTPNRLLRTADQNLARWAVQEADALIAELARTAKTVEPAPGAAANLVAASKVLVKEVENAMREIGLTGDIGHTAYSEFSDAIKHVTAALKQFPQSGGQ